MKILELFIFKCACRLCMNSVLVHIIITNFTVMNKNNYESPSLEELNVAVEFGFAQSPGYGIDAPDMEYGEEF